ncbi:hypothetical protein BKA66DRAFT_445432 [Pyrenochaeta sp. MPI-SDFR-AT-0127]|nr:hypothetical protein BKA66DRAFT_445432 [Pyrenochaeta sp. MPI-SDFR-AT-0127]
MFDTSDTRPAVNERSTFFLTKKSCRAVVGPSHTRNANSSLQQSVVQRNVGRGTDWGGLLAGAVFCCGERAWVSGEAEAEQKRVTATLTGNDQITAGEAAITKGRALEGVVVIRGNRAKGASGQGRRAGGREAGRWLGEIHERPRAGSAHWRCRSAPVGSCRRVGRGRVWWW